MEIRPLIDTRDKVFSLAWQGGNSLPVPQNHNKRMKLTAVKGLIRTSKKARHTFLGGQYLRPVYGALELTA